MICASDNKQEKNTEVRQKMCAANQEAGDKAGQGKNTKARQRKRAKLGREQNRESSP